LVIDTVTREVIVRTAIFLVRFDGALAEALWYVGNPALSCPSIKSLADGLTKVGNLASAQRETIVDIGANLQAAVFFPLALCKRGCDVEGSVR